MHNLAGYPVPSGAGRTPRATLHEGLGRTDTAVAQAFGMKQRTYAKLREVYDAAQGKKRVRGKGGATVEVPLPSPVVAVAQQQMAALDSKQATVNAAEKVLHEAQAPEDRVLTAGVE